MMYNKEKEPYPEANPVIGKCSQCEIELRRIMYYSCQNMKCPYFKKAVL